MTDLTDYVIMPGADYMAACDAVREKTGKTGGIRSGELAAEIRGIAAEGTGKTIYITVKNTRSQTLTVWYPVPGGDELQSLSVTRNAQAEVGIPAGGMLYLSTTGTLYYNSSYTGPDYTCKHTGDNVAVKAFTSQYGASGGSAYNYSYGFLVAPATLQEDGTITVSYAE